MAVHLLDDFLRESAQRVPGSVALIHGEERTSYGDLDRASDRVAGALASQGIRRGDRVGLLDDNGLDYVEGYYAVLKAGAVAVPLNTQADPRTIQGLLADCGARAVIAGRRHAPLILPGLNGLGAMEFAVLPDGDVESAPAGPVRLVRISDARAFGGPAPSLRRIDLDRASIIYTSGSTGRPKGAVLSHLNLVANTRSIVQYLELTSADRVLAVLPFYYVYGKSLLNTHVAAGGSVVIENRFLFPQVAVDTLQREACTGFAGVPSTFAILLDKTNVAKRDLPALRYVTQAGGAMAPAIIRRVMEALPRTRVFIMYGATEAGARLSYLPPDELPSRVGSIGRAIPNVELLVLRDDGSTCEPGEVGEIVARGSNIMEGYWNDPAETAAVLDRHGYHTGDLGVADEEGYLRVVGRKREMIKSGAHRISPKEIEEAILEHASVLEAAVIGIPDAMLGEAIRAYVVPREGCTLSIDAIAAHCRERLAGYKVPREFVKRGTLPKNPSGKVMKDRLHHDAPTPGSDARE
ncbi:MAG TPA: class I adenylate-forming enzyme family protein [Candidatus Polarisedimenticolaceae bacterium]